MSDTPDSRSPTANANILSPGHADEIPTVESRFVQPKTFLRQDMPGVMEPKESKEPKPLTPLDREQMYGLVSAPLLPNMRAGNNKMTELNGRVYITVQHAENTTESNSRFSQSSNQL